MRCGIDHTLASSKFSVRVTLSMMGFMLPFAVFEVVGASRRPTVEADAAVE
jgi:hypothetical protein